MAYPVSHRWENHIRRGMQPVTVCDVLFPGEGVVFENLPVSGGSISVKRENAIRTEGSLVIPDPDFFPRLYSESVIAPYGAEIAIKTGILYPEGTTELIPMGIFPIYDVSGSEREGNVCNVSFYDRAKLLEHTDRLNPKSYHNVMAIAAIEDEVMYASPLTPLQAQWSMDFDMSLPNFLLPYGTVSEENRWNFIESIAFDLGAEVFFDRNGNVMLQRIPSINGRELPLPEPDWTINPGENGNLIDINRVVTRDEVYNAVLVVGSATGDSRPPHFLIEDDWALSRTRWGGPFGKKIKKIEKPELTTVAQCEVAARAELENLTGLQMSVEIDALGNPAMDPGDVLLVVSPDGSQHILLLDGYTYDFATAAMSMDTRSVHYVHPET